MSKHSTMMDWAAFIGLAASVGYAPSGGRNRRITKRETKEKKACRAKRKAERRRKKGR